jgi:hypothetical protein
LRRLRKPSRFLFFEISGILLTFWFCKIWSHQ